METDSLTANCPDCKSVKSATEFHCDRSRRNGLQVRCKECHSRRSVAWGQTEKGREARRRYANSERGRFMAKLRKERLKDKISKILNSQNS
jgi:hypothetical protein